MNIKNRQVVCGVAGAGIFVGQLGADGPVALRQLFADGGNNPCWMGDRLLIDRFQVGLATCLPDGSDLQPLPGAPAATAYGASDDGTAWARFLADGRTGVEASWGLKLPMMRWLGMGPALFVTPQSGDALVCYDIGGLGRWVQPGVAIDFFAVDADRVLWTDGRRQIQVRGLDAPEQFESTFMPSTFEALGRRWLTYARGNGGFAIRPWDDARHGHIVVPLGTDAFDPTGVSGDDPSHVVACWSPNPSDSALFSKTVDLTAALVDLPAVVTFGARLNHRVSIAPFKDTQNRVGADSGVVVNGAAPTSKQPQWVATDDASMAFFRRGVDKGLYTEASTVEEMTAAIALAEQHETRLAWCHDGSDLDLLLVKMLRPFDQVWLECYPVAGETDAQSASRYFANLDTLLNVCGNQIGIIAPDYDAGGVGVNELRTVQQTLRALTVIPDLLNHSIQVVTLAIFEIDRGNGADAHPELMTWAIEAVAATPGVPDLPPVTSSPAPQPTPPAPKPTPSPTPISHDISSAFVLLKGASLMVISDAQFNKQPDGMVTVTIANPLENDYEGIGKKGDVLPGDTGSTDPDQHNPTGANCVLSYGPSVRKVGTAGLDEKVKAPAAGFGVLGYQDPSGHVNVVPCFVRS